MSKPHKAKDYIINRSIVLWLHDHKCYLCNDGTKAKETHHINENNKCNDITNLVPLCVSCHSLIHKSTKLKNFSNKFIVILLLKKVVLFTK